MDIRIKEHKFYIVEYKDKGRIEYNNDLYFIHFDDGITKFCKRKNQIILIIYEHIIRFGRKKDTRKRKYNDYFKNYKKKK